MAEYGGAHFDRRQFPRLDVTLPCAFEFSEENVPEGVTSNVSIGGLLVFLSQVLICRFWRRLPLLLGARPQLRRGPGHGHPHALPGAGGGAAPRG